MLACIDSFVVEGTGPAVVGIASSDGDNLMISDCTTIVVRGNKGRITPVFVSPASPWTESF